MWCASSVRRDYNFLAKFFNFEINGLADRFIMEIGTNVNCRWKNSSFQRYLLRTEKICNLKELSVIAATENPAFTTLATIYGIKKAEPI
jgi:hypothetical protein